MTYRKVGEIKLNIAVGSSKELLKTFENSRYDLLVEPLQGFSFTKSFIIIDKEPDESTLEDAEEQEGCPFIGVTDDGIEYDLEYKGEAK